MREMNIKTIVGAMMRKGFVEAARTFHERVGSYSNGELAYRAALFSK